MKSFPSTLNRGGSNLFATHVPSSIKDTLKSAWKSAVTQGFTSITSNINLDTEGIRYSEETDVHQLLERSNVTALAGNVFMTHKSEGNTTNYEDPLHLPLNAINVMNKYKAVIYKGPIETLHTPIKGPDSQNAEYLQTSVNGVTGSLFNPYYGMPYKGPTTATPLLTGDSRVPYKNVDDCSISTLVSLSNSSSSDPTELGQARYKYADFMYCKELGQISNNHLITLRRFATPVGDNIFTEAAMPGGGANNFSMPGDIGRMVTWFGTAENRLEDILRYDYNTTWKQLDAGFYVADSKEGQNTGESGGTKNIFNKLTVLTNPAFYDAVAKGTNPAVHLPFTSYTIPAGQYENDPVVLGKMYDENKVYTPKNTIRETNIYEGELKFNHEFTLTFNYKLRAYDNINPKAAFLDLLSNVLVTTYRRGEFWGGRQVIYGVPANSAGWNAVNEFKNKCTKSASQFLSDLIDGKGGEILSTTAGAISTIDPGQIAQDIKSAAKDIMRSVLNVTDGVLTNYLGRPATYALNSVINGADTGLWHVTIGNPRNPIASFGNLIITKTNVQHMGPLGVDDFPTELKVQVTLKHARPRDAFAIQRMYTKGTGSVYIGLNEVKNTSAIYKIKGTKPSEKSIVVESPNMTTIDGPNYMGDYDMERIKANRDELA